MNLDIQAITKTFENILPDSKLLSFEDHVKGLGALILC